MASASIKQKAIQLLNRRSAANSPWYYWKTNWRRWILYKLVLLAFILVLFFITDRFAAIAFACFVAGAVLRDIRWWFTLSKQWPDTMEFLDWSKIEKLATEDKKLDLRAAEKQC